MCSTNILYIPCVPQTFPTYHVFHKQSLYAMCSTNIPYISSFHKHFLHIMCSTNHSYMQSVPQTFLTYYVLHNHSLNTLCSTDIPDSHVLHKHSINIMCPKSASWNQSNNQHQYQDLWKFLKPFIVITIILEEASCQALLGRGMATEQAYLLKCSGVYLKN